MISSATEVAFLRTPGSFRDPDGYMISVDNVFLRCLKPSAEVAYERLMASGLYTSLVRDRKLIAHDEQNGETPPGVYKVLRPKQLDFISYPYEWCFSQLKDAALVTLEIQIRALENHLSLKDASAYNIQFDEGRPVFIDTSSFECYVEGHPWIGYGQFTRHFLAPLALQCFSDFRLKALSQSFLDGIPVDLARKLLPPFFWFRHPLLWLHFRLQSSGPEARTAIPKHRVTRKRLIQFTEHLISLIKKLESPAQRSMWSDYYAKNESYSQEALRSKAMIVERWLAGSRPKTVWDLGSNTGHFSRLASSLGALTIAADGDLSTVESAYRAIKAEKTTSILPLHIDLTNPSPALGWAHEERQSWTSRGPADVAMALALIHHLVITHNVPLDRLAQWFSSLCRELIIEFVPKEDVQTQKLLLGRDDAVHPYSAHDFEKAFERYFILEEQQPIADSKRILYRFIRQ